MTSRVFPEGCSMKAWSVSNRSTSTCYQYCIFTTQSQCSPGLCLSDTNNITHSQHCKCPADPHPSDTTNITHSQHCSASQCPFHTNNTTHLQLCVSFQQVHIHVTPKSHIYKTVSVSRMSASSEPAPSHTYDTVSGNIKKEGTCLWI